MDWIIRGASFICWPSFMCCEVSKRIARSPAPQPTTRRSLLAAGALGDEALHEAVILAVVLTHPTLIARFEGELEAMECSLSDHAQLRDAILAEADGPAATLTDRMAARLGPAPLEKLFALGHLQIVPAVRDPADTATAALCLTEELAKLEARRGAAREIGEAMQDLADLPDEAVTWRLGQAAAARHRSERGQTEDDAEYDVSENGIRIKRDERSAFDALLDRIGFAKDPPKGD